MAWPVAGGDLKDLIEFVLLSIGTSLEVLAIRKLILMFLLQNLLINTQKLIITWWWWCYVCRWWWVKLFRCWICWWQNNCSGSKSIPGTCSRPCKTNLCLPISVGVLILKILFLIMVKKSNMKLMNLVVSKTG